MQHQHVKDFVIKDICYNSLGIAEALMLGRADNQVGHQPIQASQGQRSKQVEVYQKDSRDTKEDVINGDIVRLCVDYYDRST